MSVRFVVFGAGAVGGVAGARLHQSGHEVALVARGAHLEAIRADGLTLLTPVEHATFAIPATADAAELGVGRPGDVVLLAVKSQDTAGALDQLQAAGADAQTAIVCLQNGVENERVALRRFSEVYGAAVMAPTAHLEPGVVQASGATLSGIVDVGRYPAGAGGRCEEICAALGSSRFISRAVADVMRLKYAKLVLNLGNVVGALFGEGSERERLTERVREEGSEALTAAGIAHDDPDVADLKARWQRLGVAPIAGRERPGSSTWQSLARGAGALETDHLNGEISLVGRLHGVPTPLNDALCRLAADHARRRGGPGELSLDALAAIA